MVRRTAGRIKRMLTGGEPKAEREAHVTLPPAVLETVRPIDPVENYYRHKAETNLQVFYRFALQTRSVAIRDTFAKASSTYGIDLESLLGLIQDAMRDAMTADTQQRFLNSIDSLIILTLADLLANTARNDLDTSRAVSIYDFVAKFFGTDAFEESHKLQYVEALHELERYSDSERLADTFQINDYASLQKELLGVHRMRNTAKIDQWVAALNDLYDSVDLSRVRLSDDDSLAILDRLSSAAEVQLHGPKISVIMPTYAPGDGIFTAIRSLLEQTWQNLEIIVVNDASPDSYDELFSRVEALDPRVTVLHQEANAGAYVARNRGLSTASGDFVTTHDDDDWSHPDKLARQVQVMIDDANIVATTSGHIRTSPDLHFRRVNMKAQYLQMNYSSLMFRREVVDVIGPWDTVNRGGDSEFYTRLKEYFGGERILGIHDVPLSFSRVWDGSLTSGEMSRGYFAYSRLLYRWSFRQWHWDTKKQGQDAIRKPGDQRPYAIPTTFEAGKRNDDLGHFDVVYVTDFFRQAKYVDFVLNELETLADYGYRVGYMHLYSPETVNAAGIPKRLFDLQKNNKVWQLSHDDIASTDVLLVYGTSIGMFLDQLDSSLSVGLGLVVSHTLPGLRGSNSAAARPVQALMNLSRAFKVEFQVVGATEDDQKALRLQLPPGRVMADQLLWNLHVNSRDIAIRTPQTKPVVGFHSYGNQYRWPNNIAKFRDTYFSPVFDTRFYGYLERPMEKFGLDAFKNAEVVQGGDEDSFLASLDFWVYSPHSRLEDQIWLPVISALGRGKVVVLPKRLKHFYGDACVYADSGRDVEAAVSHFTNNPAEYIEQARRGMEYVAQHFSEPRLCERIELLKPSSISDAM